MRIPIREDHSMLTVPCRSDRNMHSCRIAHSFAARYLTITLELSVYAKLQDCIFLHGKVIVELNTP